MKKKVSKIVTSTKSYIEKDHKFYQGLLYEVMKSMIFKDCIRQMPYLVSFLPEHAEKKIGKTTFSISSKYEKKFATKSLFESLFEIYFLK